MLFKSTIFLALSSFGSAISVSQAVPADTMLSNIDRLTTLTRIAGSINQYVVYVNNPLVNRQETISILGAMSTQGTLDQDLMNGKACGSLTKRSSGFVVGRTSAYTAGEQANVASAYATFINATESFIALAIEKHYAVVAHNASYAVGHGLEKTYGVLAKWTDTMMTTLPTQEGFMTIQKSFLTTAYTSAIAIYLTGPN